MLRRKYGMDGDIRSLVSRYIATPTVQTTRIVPKRSSRVALDGPRRMTIGGLHRPSMRISDAETPDNGCDNEVASLALSSHFSI